MDIHYTRAAIFCPGDLFLADDAIRDEAAPNTEMTLIADVNRKLLKLERKPGSSMLIGTSAVCSLTAHNRAFLVPGHL